MFGRGDMIAAGLFAALAVLPAARADFTATLSGVVAQQGLSYKYTYTLANDPSSTIPATALEIDVDAGADLQSITAPLGWDVSYGMGDLLVSFQSTGPQYDLPPGGSAQFSFVSAEAPALNNYFVQGFDPNSLELGSSMGTVLSPGPQVVPEPATLTQVVVGSVVLAGLKARRRRAPGRSGREVPGPFREG